MSSVPWTMIFDQARPVFERIDGLQIDPPPIENFDFTIDGINIEMKSGAAERLPRIVVTIPEHLRQFLSCLWARETDAGYIVGRKFDDEGECSVPYFKRLTLFVDWDEVERKLTKIRPVPSA